MKCIKVSVFRSQNLRYRIYKTLTLYSMLSNKQSKRLKRELKAQCKQEEQLNNIGSARQADSQVPQQPVRLPDIGSYWQRAPTFGAWGPHPTRLQAQQYKATETIPNTRLSSQSEGMLETFKQFLIFKQTQASRQSVRHHEEKMEDTVHQRQEEHYYSEQQIQSHIRQRMQIIGSVSTSLWITFILESPILRLPGYRNARNYETFLRVIKEIELQKPIQKQHPIKLKCNNAKVFSYLFGILKNKEANEIQEMKSTKWLQLIEKKGYKCGKDRYSDYNYVVCLMGALTALNLVSEGVQQYYWRWEGMKNFLLPPLNEKHPRSKKSGYRIAHLLLKAFRKDRTKEWRISKLFQTIENTSRKTLTVIVRMFESLKLIRWRIDSGRQLFTWNVPEEHEELRGWELWNALNSEDNDENVD